jgi:hypothetical protein
LGAKEIKRWRNDRETQIISKSDKVHITFAALQELKFMCFTLNSAVVVFNIGSVDCPD